ncbi:MAG: winged helix-turn-helix domain-containing protein, partial [Blautia coccoides]
IGDVTVYVKERKVMKGEEELILKPMEFDCLMLFIKNKNIALTREQILNELWGIQFEGETRTVDVHVARIRKKLGWQEMIRTVPRIGYRLEAEK